MKFASDRSCQQQQLVTPSEGISFWHQNYVIYCADWQLKLLDIATILDQLIIGTFNVCPRGIQQLINISIKKHAHSDAIPLIWALMEGKDENFLRSQTIGEFV